MIKIHNLIKLTLGGGIVLLLPLMAPVCRAENVILSAYVVAPKGAQTINDFDFRTVNIDYAVHE